MMYKWPCGNDTSACSHLQDDYLGAFSHPSLSHCLSTNTPNYISDQKNLQASLSEEFSSRYLRRGQLLSLM